MEVVDFDAIGFEAALLLLGAVDGEIGGEAALAVDDAEARRVVGVGIVVENVADDASEMGIAKVGGNLAVGDDFAGGDGAEIGINGFGERGRGG